VTTKKHDDDDPQFKMETPVWLKYAASVVGALAEAHEQKKVKK